MINLNEARMRGMWHRLKSLLYHLPIVVVALIVIIPFVWMVSNSFKPGPEVFAYPPTLLPKESTMENYYRLFQVMPFTANFLNSMIVAVVYIVITLFFSSLAGFAFAKYEFPFKNLLFAGVLGSMMISLHAVIIPLFLLMARIGWLNTLYPLMIPFLTLPLGTFFMRQYILSIPSELLDTARIDGCPEFSIYHRIILPLCKPALGALAIFGGLFSWNSFLWPFVVLSKSSRFTLPIAIANLVQVFEEKPEFGVIFAACSLSILPILILFVFMQKQFISGIMLGSIKG